MLRVPLFPSSIGESLVSNDGWSPVRGGMVEEPPPDEINGEEGELTKDTDLVPDFMCWELDR